MSTIRLQRLLTSSPNFRRYETFTLLKSVDRNHKRWLSKRPAAYEGHVPLNWFENAFLAVGSAVMSLVDPRRGGACFVHGTAFSSYIAFSNSYADMVAALGETTAGPALPRLRDIMLESEEGCRILKERPKVNTHTVDMDALSKLPEGSFGRSYVSWLNRCGVTPDTREPVRILTLSCLISHGSPCSLLYPAALHR